MVAIRSGGPRLLEASAFLFALIHRSAWKVDFPKPACRVLHKPSLAVASEPSEGPGARRRNLHIVVVDKDAQV